MKEKEEHYIMIKESIQEVNITLVNIYTPNTGAPKYIKQILTDKWETDNNVILVGKFNTSLTLKDRPSRQKIHKATVVVNNTINYICKIDVISYIYIWHTYVYDIYIYNYIYSSKTEYIIFSSAHGMFSKIDHILGCKTSLNKFKDRNCIKRYFQPWQYETRNQLQKEKLEKSQYVETKKYVTEKATVNGEIKQETRKWKLKRNFPKSVGCSKISSKREVHSDTGLL